jgi:hypothetical protein
MNLDKKLKDLTLREFYAILANICISIVIGTTVINLIIYFIALYTLNKTN